MKVRDLGAIPWTRTREVTHRLGKGEEPLSSHLRDTEVICISSRKWAVTCKRIVLVYRGLRYIEVDLSFRTSTQSPIQVSVRPSVCRMTTVITETNIW